MDLEPIDPQKAVELYLTDREPEVRETTLKLHRSRLRYLVEWCNENGITNLDDLTDRRLHKFRIWRRNEGDLAPPIERTQMATIRVFLRWLGTIDGVDPDLHHKVRVPKYAKGEHTRDAVIDSETAEQMLAYLGTYEYASRDHVIISLLWHTMIRRGGIRALDLDGPIGWNPHDLMREDIFAGTPEGKEKAFGTQVHEFTEAYARREDVELSNPDEEHVKAFIDGLEGALKVETEAYLPLDVDGEGATLSGAIDLVQLLDDEVRIYDFKTDRGRHAQSEYRKQLSVYYHVLEGIVPGPVCQRFLNLYRE